MWCDVLLLFWFALLFYLVMLSIFLYVFFGRNVYSDLLAHFLIGFFYFLVLSCMNCLYVLDINCLSVISFANIFSYSVGCLSFCQWLPLLCKKNLRLIRSYSFIFAFIFAVERSKKILQQFMSRSVLPVFSSKCFFGFTSYVWVFNPCWVYFLCMVWENVLISFFYM